MLRRGAKFVLCQRVDENIANQMVQQIHLALPLKKTRRQKTDCGNHYSALIYLFVLFAATTATPMTIDVSGDQRGTSQKINQKSQCAFNRMD